jgi:hypothetical protein
VFHVLISLPHQLFDDMSHHLRMKSFMELHGDETMLTHFQGLGNCVKPPLRVFCFIFI